MPKSYEYKVAGYYLYFTSFCTIECTHVHASDRKLIEAGSAKFFVKENGEIHEQSLSFLPAKKPDGLKLSIIFLYWSIRSLNIGV